jgi:hypothetical protein
VVDFGSAELKIFRWLKDVESVERMALVDVDSNVLESNKNVVKPLILDNTYPRSTPLTIAVLAGSAGDLDRRIVGYQAATLVEL